MMEADDRKKNILYAAGLGLLSAAVHLLPFLLYGGNPLGYDTGFYRRYLIEPFLSLPNTPVPGLGADAVLPRLLLDIGRIAHVPPDALLYGSYLLCFALLPVLIFLLLQPTLGRRGACIAGLFIIGSAVSYNAYWYMLWKNAFALDLMVLAFMFIERRRTLLLVAVSAAIALSHQTSTIVYLAALGVFFLLEKGRRWDIIAAGATALALFLAVNFSFIHQVSVALPAAVFLSWGEYLRMSAPFLILIACGFGVFREMRPPRILLAFGLAAFAFPILHLPFYERIFIFCDIALAVAAAYAAEYLIARIITRGVAQSYLPAAALCIAVGLLAGNFWGQVRSLRPLLPPEDIKTIQAVGTALPSEAYLLTTSDEAPWYEGWTSAHVIAPGLLHDTHNLEEWTAFWTATSSAERIIFLNSFPKPLYISTLGPLTDLIGEPPTCLTEIQPHLSLDECR